MSDQPETLAAILAEMRNRADTVIDGRVITERNLVPQEAVEDWADRIEATYKQERAQWRGETNAAKEARNRIACKMRYEFAAKCRACKAAPGNASSCAPMSLDEAIKHAEERADGSPCGQAHAQLAGWLRELRDRRTAPGNAAAIRAALVEVECAIFEDEPGRFWLSDAEVIFHRVQAALAAPPRNCDVGTAQEQIDRFHEFCHSNRLYIDEFHGYDCRPDCPIGKIVDRDNKFCDNCWAAWSQMPFAPAEGGAE